jgi:hypothetical protein
MNDNKLIAEFMGRGGTFNHDKTMICTGIYPDTMTLMKYHTSWDWLMPVLRNISDTAKLYELPEDSNLIEDITNGLVSIDIEMTFEAVVEFIKEYNLKS